LIQKSLVASQLLSSIVPDNSGFIFCEILESSISHENHSKWSNAFYSLETSSFSTKRQSCSSWPSLLPSL